MKDKDGENKDFANFPMLIFISKITQHVCSVCSFFPYDLQGVVLTGMELTEQCD